MRKILFYRTASDRSPVEEFLDTLPGKAARKVIWVLRLVEDLDPVPRQYFKKLQDTDGLWEMRAQHGGDAFRFLGFFDGPHWVVLTNGFAKKTAKSPDREIALAQRRRRDYLNRRSDNE